MAYKRRILFFIIGIFVLAVGWWLLSPLWRNVKLDEAFPDPPATPGVKDNLNTMDEETKERFVQETEKMMNQRLMMDEVIPPQQPNILKEATMVPHAHDVAGKVLLIQTSENQYTVRFEDLKTINGPDLRIYLSSDLSADDFVDLGAIRATEGNVNYRVPEGVDVTKYRHVLIWCRAFGVLFSSGSF